MSSQTSFSETAQQNMSFNIQLSTNKNEQSEKQNLNSKKRVFEVFHKKDRKNYQPRLFHHNGHTFPFLALGVPQPETHL
jgi:hypothetical protein